jgi:hypothetical protein
MLFVLTKRDVVQDAQVMKVMEVMKVTQVRTRTLNLHHLHHFRHLYHSLAPTISHPYVKRARVTRTPVRSAHSCPRTASQVAGVLISSVCHNDAQSAISSAVLVKLELPAGELRQLSQLQSHP